MEWPSIYRRSIFQQLTRKSYYRRNDDACELIRRTKVRAPLNSLIADLGNYDSSKSLSFMQSSVAVAGARFFLSQS